MAVIAKVPILYRSVQYRAGDIIRDYDMSSLALWLKHGAVQMKENLNIKKLNDGEAELGENEKSDLLNFKSQLKKDLDHVFFNLENDEFVTTHKIAGVRGKSVECNVIVDKDLYRERNIKDNVENISIDGLVFFIKKEEWLEKLENEPKVKSKLTFDGELYRIEAVNDETSVLEITLTANRGSRG